MTFKLSCLILGQLLAGGAIAIQVHGDESTSSTTEAGADAKVPAELVLGLH